MDWSFLSFLAAPWFVIPWYAVGILGAAFVAWDEHVHNTPLKQAMKWAWPIIALFFSVLGLALYFATARAPGISQLQDDEAKQEAHAKYEENMFRRVNGAVIHCVAGDGIGIMTGMVIARAVQMNAWQEFWFEYAVGFLCGWLIFQLKSMTMMTGNIWKALGMGFRGEFFSMLTVMGGMGAVMMYVTPLAVTQQPKPLTFAFWGFGALGLMVGYVLTFPMNWLMVKIGWKHGMGPMEGARTLESTGARAGVFATMGVLGLIGLVLPAWLVTVRDRHPVLTARAAMSRGMGGGPRTPVAELAEGTRRSVETALEQLGQNGTDAMVAMDAARRAAKVGANAAPGSGFKEAKDAIESARRAIHQGNADAAREQLQIASEKLRGVQSDAAGTPPEGFDAYDGATVVNANGARIGEVSGRNGAKLKVELGSGQDVWGFWDVGAKQHLEVPMGEVLFGPTQTVGRTLVALPTEQRSLPEGLE